MRYRVLGAVTIIFLFITVGAFWGANNFAAEPIDELIQRAYTFVAIGASTADHVWLRDATTMFERASKADPDSAEAHLMAGMGFQVSGNVQAAVMHYEAAGHLAPGLPVDALIGEAYLTSGDLEQAEAAYVSALNTDPESALALSGLALLTELTGRTLETEAYLRRITQIKAPEPGPYLELSRFFLRTGDPELALDTLEEIEEAKRGGAAYFAQLGFVYEALNRPDDACPQLRSAMQLGSSDPAVSAAIERIACGARS